MNVQDPQEHLVIPQVDPLFLIMMMELVQCVSNSYSYTTPQIGSGDGTYISFAGPDNPGVTTAGITLGTPKSTIQQQEAGCSMTAKSCRTHLYYAYIG